GRSSTRRLALAGPGPPRRGLVAGRGRRRYRLQARAQRLDEIDDLRCGRTVRIVGSDDLLAGDLLLDRGEDALLLLVDILGGVEALDRGLLDEPARQLELGGSDLDQVDVEIGERAHLFG